jgi:hypothetical protein
MATHCIPQLSFKFDKRVVAKFDTEHASFCGPLITPRRPPLRLPVTNCVRSSR